MDTIITKKEPYTSIKLDPQYPDNETLAAVIKDLELELGKAATKVFRNNQRITTVINYIEVGEEDVMVSASFHGE